MSLKNKVAIVTGSSSGIGAAIAEKFAEEGAKVAIVGRNKEKLANVNKTIENKGSKPLVIVANVTDEEDRKKIIFATVKEFGRLDILVNNAGVGGTAEITAENAMEVFNNVFNTNFLSVVYLTHLAVPHLIKTKGNIINISSICAIDAYGPAMFSYGSSKAALDHFTRCIAVDLAPNGIRVNGIKPGPVITDILENTGLDKATAVDYWNNMKHITLLKRVGEAEEIAELAVFIASDKGRSLTGSSIVSDNGALLCRTVMPRIQYEQ